MPEINLMPALPPVFFRLMLLMALLASPLPAQDAGITASESIRYEFQRIGLADGLPSQHVNCIVQDRYGFIWFGTRHGLARFDGRRMKTYRSIPGDTTSLAGNDILLLFSDSQGNLWIGANGLHRFEFDREQFRRIRPPGQKALFDKLQYAVNICEDNRGNIWLGTFNNGLFKFDPRSEVLSAIALHSPENPAAVKMIHSLSPSGSDTLWITSTNHLLIALDTQTGKQTPIILTNRADIQNCFADRAGRLWLAEAGKPLQQVFPGPGGKAGFTPIENIRPRKDNMLYCFAEDRNGELWIGASDGGVFVYTPSSGEIRHHRHNSRLAASLPSDDIHAIYRDKAGNMWIGTSNGVARRARWKKPFHHFRHDTEQAASINNAEVTGIDQDNEGNLWISTLNAGFAKFDIHQQTFTRFDPSTSKLRSPWTMEILAGRSGAVWVATNFKHGLNYFHPQSGQFREYHHQPGDSTSLSSNLVTTLYEDRDGKIWIGAAYHGLNLFDASRNTFQRFQYRANDSTSLSSNNVLAIAEDAGGALWIGTDNGLNRFDNHKKTFTRYLPTGMPKQSAAINAILPDQDDKLWLGTNSGLMSFAGGSGEFTSVTTLPNLADGRVFGILQDNYGHLWLQMTGAVAQFSPEKNRLTAYGREDGWINGAVNELEWHHSLHKLKSGELAFGGTSGLTIFNPGQIRNNPDAPPVYITGFNLYYQPVELNSSRQASRKKGEPVLTRSLLFTGQLVLKHYENAFSFEFAALDYTQPEANQYAFWLEGSQAEWVYCGNNNVATFTNIPPGEYRFRVKASNNDEVWNEDGAAVAITILAPWWQTKTAYFFYLLGILAALLTWRHFEFSRIQMRNQLRMREFEAEKLKEVDQMKSRFFTNISHEFRTPLTLILGPLDGLLTRITDLAARDDLVMMERSARRLLRLINQLLDLSRLDSGHMSLETSTGGFSTFLRGVTLSFSSLAEQRGIQLQFDFPAEVAERLDTELYYDLDKVEKMITNLLSNALKFTPAGGQVRLECALHRTDATSGGSAAGATAGLPAARQTEYACLRLQDTGIGIAADRLPLIFDRFYQVDTRHNSKHEGSGVGLALTRELVECHRGFVTVDSKPGEGTVFSIYLPLGRQHLRDAEIRDTPATRSSEAAPLPDLSLPLPDEEATADRNADIILLIDDHPDIRHYIRSHLTGNFEVIEAPDGSEGVKTALESIPDLIICDVMMPGLDGFQVCAMLKTDEKTSHIPIILLTAKAGEESRLEGLETGADDYLLKPFNARELQTRVKNLISQRRSLRERFRREGLLQPREIAGTSVEEAFIHRLMEILETHIAEEEFSVDILAGKLFMSSRQLQRKIRALTGQSPSDLIRNTRLERARQMLEQHRGTVSEIAFAVGFNNLSWFARAFREHFGLAPSEITGKTTGRSGDRKRKS